LRNQIKKALLMSLLSISTGSYALTESEIKAMQDRMSESMAAAAKMSADGFYQQAPVTPGQEHEFLNSLGLSEESQSELYVFITWNMGEKLINQYLDDAVASGAKVILYGAPADVNSMEEYFNKYIKNMMGNRSVYSDVILDPTLFESYDVQLLPAVVYAPASQGLCKESYFAEEVYIDKTFEMPRCVPEAQDSYYKITGTVSVEYALEEFKKAGADVQARLDLIKKYYETGGEAAKEEAFNQLWEFGEYSNGEYKPHEFEVKNFIRNDQINYDK